MQLSAWTAILAHLHIVVTRRPRRVALRLVALASLFILGLLWPWVFLAALLSAVVFAFWVWRQARRPDSVPSVGPPFQLPYFSDGEFLLEQAERLGPLFVVRPLLSPLLCIVDLALASRFLRDCGEQLETPELVLHRLIDLGFLRGMQPAEHRKYKPALRAAVAADALAANEDFLRDSVRHCVSVMHRDMPGCRFGGLRPGPYLMELLLRCWARLFFGIAPDDSRYAQLVATNQSLDRFKLGRASEAGAGRKLNDLVEMLAQQSAVQSVDTAHSFLAAMTERVPWSASDRTAVGNLVVLFNNSVQDVYGLLCWVVWMLAHHPAEARKVREQLTAPADHRAAAQAQEAYSTCIVMETLRLRQSEYLWRRTTDDVRFAGYSIPAGTLVRIAVRECHRDARIFERPREFDPSRFIRRKYSSSEFAPFGLDNHACLGPALTLRFGSWCVEEMCRSFTWRTVRDGPSHFSSFGRHWAPNPGFRVAATLAPAT